MSERKKLFACAVCRCCLSTVILKDIPHIWNVDGHAHDPTEWRNNLITHYVGTRFLQRVFR